MNTTGTAILAAGIAMLALAACPQTKRTNTAQSAAAGSASASSSAAGSMDGAAMLAAHNSWRAKVNAPPLRWSAKLAAVAQQWADHLAGTECGSKHSNNKYGENIYWSGPKSWPDGRRELRSITAKDVVDYWGGENKHYDYSTGTCEAICGHYTQVVWKDSKELGCGMAVCGSKAQLWVCNYNPPGNVAGRKPY